MQLTRAILRTTILILLTVVVPLACTPKSSPEQQSFSAEDETVKHAAPVPPQVLAILARDSDVQQAREALNLSVVPMGWFPASEIHLHGREERDLVVMGIGPIRGANVTTFWI